METILYAACGSTELSIHGITFATEGAKNFMESIIKIDDQDLVSKLEGFAVQGVQGIVHFAHPLLLYVIVFIGATSNYRQRVSKVCIKIGNIINTKLHMFLSLSSLDSDTNPSNIQGK